ncbi:MAG: hypothetical protein ACJ71T_11665 [Actinomycetales bacterium]
MTWSGPVFVTVHVVVATSPGLVRPSWLLSATAVVPLSVMTGAASATSDERSGAAGVVAGACTVTVTACLVLEAGLLTGLGAGAAGLVVPVERPAPVEPLELLELEDWPDAESDAVLSPEPSVLTVLEESAELVDPPEVAG